MQKWIASGDETGGWDIIDGSFSSEFTGLAWVLAPISAWDRALQMPLGGFTAADVFSQPFAARMPKSLLWPESSEKYHLRDVWAYCRERRISGDLTLGVPHEDPVLELLRGDAEWLLQRSGLGVLAAGGSSADAKASGLGLSGDGLRERARAFAGLMTVAMPFLPGDASLNLVVEGRTESDVADAVANNRFAQRTAGMRYSEPYRDFIGRLTEDLVRASERCQPVVTDGRIISTFSSISRSGLRDLKRHEFPFLRAHPDKSFAAIKGIADLGAALMSHPMSKGCRMVVPDNFSANHWSGNFRELRHAIRA